MVLARVKGQAVAAARVPDLDGRRLLLVELLTVEGEEVVPTRRHMVCVDAVGAGRGETVLLVQGSSARQSPGMGNLPVDAVLVGIVESVSGRGRRFVQAAA